MKKISVWFFSICVCLFSFLMTSCLDSEETPMHRPAFVTIQDYLGEKRLIWDNNDITLIPSLSSVALYDDFKGQERAFVIFALQEGFTDTEKSVWYIDLVFSPYYPSPFVIPTKSLSTQPDTLRNDSIIKLSALWADKGYITVISDFYYDAQGKSLDNYLGMVQEEIKEDTLVLSLKYNAPNNNVREGQSYYNSFRLPRKSALLNDIKHKEDSIVIQVQAKVKSGTNSQIVKEHIKYKLY